MKIGDFEKFNEFCGIAYIENEESKEAFYVVYATTGIHDFPFLGSIVSKGKSKEEALVNSIKFFIKREKDFEDKTIDEKGFLESLYKYLHYHMFSNDDQVILPVKDCDWKGDLSEKYYNASILISKGKAIEAIM